MKAIHDFVICKYDDAQEKHLQGIIVPETVSLAKKRMGVPNGDQLIELEVVSVGPDVTDYDGKLILTPPAPGQKILVQRCGTEFLLDKKLHLKVQIRFVVAVKDPISSKWMPISDRVKMKIDFSEATMYEDIHLPKHSVDRPRKAKVLAIGSGKKGLYFQITPGDNVIIDKLHTELKTTEDNETVHFIRYQHIVSIYTEA